MWRTPPPSIGRALYHGPVEFPDEEGGDRDEEDTVLAALAGGLLLSTFAFAATAKTYQVTGPVLEINSDMIVVQKGKDRWEIARDAR